ncbi:MFS transporter [Propionivibrio sp.]|uniref:MFS transporter n=1 Tax=Propionivibrio sp. TaxID=2212460 RepID=UPI0026385DF2|nr:MFS transporter [Propionivibrio sp.]
MPAISLVLDPLRRRRTIFACCGAHVLHDGFSDLLFVLFPVWQVAFGLSLAQVGLLKTLCSASMASLQVPMSLLSERIGERVLLALGTLVAAGGFMMSGWTAGFVGLALCLMLSGAGASVQHPLGSALVSRVTDGTQLRAALSAYNFSGDIGKVLLPALCAALLAVYDWHFVISLMGMLGLGAALAVWFALPREQQSTARVRVPDMSATTEGHLDTLATRGFISLAAIGVIDSATRMGFLSLLPFALIAKGASVTQTGFALSLAFAGGATGKFFCGLLAVRAGVLRTLIITELATAIGIVLILPLSLEHSMLLLPVIGIALNGTSSVLYGTVPELVPVSRRSRAFGVFYTLTIGAGAFAPALYGLIGDRIGVPHTFEVIAAFVLLVLPLTLGLRPALRALQLS